MNIKMNFIVGVALILQISFIKAQDANKEFMTDRLISSIEANNYTAYASKINTSDPSLFNEIIRDILKYEFDQIYPEKLVKFFKTYENKEQSLFGYSAVFDELKKRNRLNEPLLVTLAFGLKDVLGDNLSSEAEAEGNSLKDALPESVRNLAFASRVCIKNNVYKEYLFAASDDENQDESRRRIFTWIPREKNPEGYYWAVEPNKAKDAFYIMNTERNEYLFSPNWMFNWDGFTKNIFTWIPGGNANNSTKFEYDFTPSGDNVFIRNMYYNQRLFVSEIKYNDDSRRVFTDWARKADDKFIWKIEDCSKNF